MSNTKLYAAIYVVLFVMATAQVAVEYMGLPLVTALVAILALSFVKAAIVAGYYQHLRSEPRAVTYLMVIGLIAALALTAAASYSIT
jgi:cytochrome c oxidase subunit 4